MFILNTALNNLSRSLSTLNISFNRKFFLAAGFIWACIGIGSNLMTMYVKVMTGQETAFALIGLIGSALLLCGIEMFDRTCAMSDIVLAAQRQSATPRPAAVHDLCSLRQLSWEYELSL